MYADNESVHLLDQQDYNQYAVPVDELASETPYITEGLEGMLALIYNDQCVGLQLPAAVALKIIECDPAVKGNSATLPHEAGEARNRADHSSARVSEGRRARERRHAKRGVLASRLRTRGS